MRKIFLLRGAPGSGKSSFIARHHLQPYAISRDEIRLLLADLTVYYEESTDHLHQVIPRHVTVRTEQMVDNLVQHKMAYGETIIVDGTHITPDKIEHFRPWVEKYRYELFVVDLMQNNTLESLLQRNQVRMHYDWVKPDVIKMMYEQYKAHPEVPSWAYSILPNGMERALGQKEKNLDHYSHVICVPDKVRPEDFPHVHISNFYFSFNDEFTKKYGTYRNVITLGKTREEVIEQFRLPYFVFKFHHKHFLISAYPIRNEMLDPIRKVKGVWSYSTGLYNIADFILSRIYAVFITQGKCCNGIYSNSYRLRYNLSVIRSRLAEYSSTHSVGDPFWGTCRTGGRACTACTVWPNRRRGEAGDAWNNFIFSLHLLLCRSIPKCETGALRQFLSLGLDC